MWRKPVQCRRVNLTAELTSASVYLIWESHCPCLKEKRMLRLSKTALAHALIILPWPSWASCASQSVYKEKRWSSKEGDPARQVTLLVSSAVEWPLVARSCLQFSCSPIEKKRDQSGRARSGREGRGKSLPFCFPPSHHPSRSLRSRFLRSKRVEQSLFSFRFSKAIFVSRAFPSRD